jgi:flavin-dependent dehydrogenase
VRSVDTVVVGGGPAGSTCAWALRRAGLDALVLDRSGFPRDKPCAGWLTPQAVSALALDRADYARGRVLQKVTGMRASRMGGPEVESRFDEVVSYGVRRCEFDHYLLQRSGAPVLTTAVDKLRRVPGGFLIDGEILTPVVVGAGGHFCPVARWLGAGAGEPVIVAQELEHLLEGAARRLSPVDGETPELYFCRDLAGYGWLFRKGDYLNVGFGRKDAHGFPAHLREFYRFLTARGRIDAETPSRWPGHAYLVYDDSKRLPFDEGVLLVGDAAGLAYSESGEGIGPAIDSALLAAETILEARGDYSRESLQAYARRLAARFGARPRLDPLRYVPRFVRGAIGGWILASKALNRRLVVERWFLHREKPSLEPPPLLEAHA